MRSIGRPPSGWSEWPAPGGRSTACEGECKALAEGQHFRHAEEAAGLVRPVWTEVDEEVFRGYLQRGNSMGDGTNGGFEG